ncbi:unnamed protein product [Soboliphyme baturini]|uniref:VWFA domain-containing protein n=1 Tax=Soboliphyme baturini TaxID=241478 RepID=A0A183IV55_9BILA|nr:unnamed protein product [Soboliphyme baturini]
MAHFPLVIGLSLDILTFSMRIALVESHPLGDSPLPVRDYLFPTADDLICRPAAVDLVILVDTSNSMDDIFKEEKAVLFKMSKFLPVSATGTMVCFIQYSNKPLLVMPFSDAQSPLSLYNATKSLEALGGETHTAEAVLFALEQLKLNGRRSATKVLVLLSDGNSINSWNVVEETAKELRKSKVNVIVVALGSQLFMPELKLYAGSMDSVYDEGNIDKLEGVLRDIVGDRCRVSGSED